MRTLAATASLLLTIVPCSQAQPALPPHPLCTPLTDCATPTSAVDAPFGFAVEDWSPQYASGRAHLSTLVPMVVGSVLLRIHEAGASDPSLNDPLAIAALGLSATGAVIGPSMGAWCLGGDCARRSWLPLGLRVLGASEVVWAARWARRRTDSDEALGVGSILVGTFLSIPGFIVLGLGIAWSFRNTPRLRCGSGADTPMVGIAPAASAVNRGSGLALRLTL